MPTYMARSEWKGTLKDGAGRLRVGSGSFETAVAPKTSEGKTTNPEEVVGAALAGCYSMMLAKKLEDAGYKPRLVKAIAGVDLEHGDDGPHIPQISLTVDVDAEDLDDDTLKRIAREADDHCPVSLALRGTTVNIDAKLNDRHENK